MADVFAVKGYDGADWDITIGATDVIGFCGSTFAHKQISVGAYQDSTHKTDASMSADLCTPDHMRNTKYVSATQVKLMDGSAVTLNATNVQEEDCTIRVSYQDTLQNTELEDCYLFAYDGSDVYTEPDGMRVLAFERVTGAINKDRLSDATGDGGAWKAGDGIGGLDNALICDDQGSASTHYFYFGLCGQPLSKGLKSATLRIEFTAF